MHTIVGTDCLFFSFLLICINVSGNRCHHGHVCSLEVSTLPHFSQSRFTRKFKGNIGFQIWIWVTNDEYTTILTRRHSNIFVCRLVDDKLDFNIIVQFLSNLSNKHGNPGLLWFYCSLFLIVQDQILWEKTNHPGISPQLILHMISTKYFS